MKILVKLPEVCTIRNVESFMEKTRTQIKEDNKLEVLCLDVSVLEKIDTSFFQFLLALKKHMEVHRGEFKVRGNSESLNQIMLYFGIQL